MDIYDQEVERLTKLQGEWEQRNPRGYFRDSPLYSEWNETKSPLFARVGPYFLTPYDVPCGCLTQVHSGMYAWTAELTEEIRADSRIPNDGMSLTVEVLPVFAEWRRKIDALGIMSQVPTE